MPEDIPEHFDIGELLSAAALNRMQRALLERLAGHDHSGGANADPIGTPGLQDRSVTEPKLADGAVTAAKLGNEAVSARALAHDAVQAEHLAANAVETPAIADNSVTQEKLSPDVLGLLLRVGGGASSASQVIWRDPEVVYPTINSVGVIAGILNPIEWAWPIGVVSIGASDVPVKLNPNTDASKTLEVIDLATMPSAEKVVVEQQMTAAVLDAAVNITAVAGFLKGGGTGFVPGVERTTMPPAPAGDRFGTGMPAATRGGVTAPAATAPPAATPERTMIMRSTAAPDARGVTPTPAAIPTDAKPTLAATQAARRMTTIDNVNAKGAPVSASDPDAITVGSGFSGQDNFTKGGAGINFRDLGGSNASAKREAEEAAGKMLFNLGFDTDLKGPTNITNKINELLNGKGGFLDDGNPLWSGTSWLPDILNRPELFGTGYSLSGGRNIQSVTRQFTKGKPSDHWVRVQFITPYRNASYAVTVTPRSDSDYEMISANIRAKTTDYVDLQFTAAFFDEDQNNALTYKRLSKLSFDLAIFGELGVAS